MDRREALKKIGAGGGAVAVGSIAISSSRVFAASTPQPVAPTISVTTDPNERTAIFTLTQNNGTCGGSSVGTPSRTSSFSSSVTGGGATISPPGSGTIATGGTGTVTALANAASPNKFVAADQVRIVITTIFKCTAGGVSTCSTVVYTFNYTYSLSAKNFTLSSSSSTTPTAPVSC